MPSFLWTSSLSTFELFCAPSSFLLLLLAMVQVVYSFFRCFLCILLVHGACLFLVSYVFYTWFRLSFSFIFSLDLPKLLYLILTLHIYSISRITLFLHHSLACVLKSHPPLIIVGPFSSYNLYIPCVSLHLLPHICWTLEAYLSFLAYVSYVYVLSYCLWLFRLFLHLLLYSCLILPFTWVTIACDRLCFITKDHFPCHCCLSYLLKLFWLCRLPTLPCFTLYLPSTIHASLRFLLSF